MLLFTLGFLAISSSAQNTISIAGAWRFQLDREDVGLRGKWHEGKLEQAIRLPGSLQNQGFGDDISINTDWLGAPNLDLWLTGPQYEQYRKPGNLKIPFGLQPQKHYAGAAWYQRDIEVPSSWKGKQIVLTLERAHWETQVWLDRSPKGTNSSLSTPHVYDLGTGISPGRHTLTIRVDNRMIENVGTWANSVSDQSQGNWNGLIGRLELSAGSPIWIENVQVYPVRSQKSVRLKIRLGNASGAAGNGKLMAGGSTFPVTWTKEGGTVEAEVRFKKSVQPWDEFTPAVQTLDLELITRSGIDRRTVVFGWREIAAIGNQLAVNGRKTFLRGTVESCVFPLTGYPPTEVEAWKRIMNVCRSYGLNHLRFHSYCPPEAAFEAADHAGIYLAADLPAWTAVGDGKPIDSWLEQETEKILAAYGNHPSFILLTGGNDPSGKNAGRWMSDWVNRRKAEDTRRLYTGASGATAVPENQYNMVEMSSDLSGSKTGPSIASSRVPALVHELGQWAAYPDFDQITKYSGPFKPKNLEIIHDSLARHGLEPLARNFSRASGKLQTLCYKEQIEQALRTPGTAGFQMMSLTDFPGQGTSPVGVLDCFWEPKPYVTPEEFRKFCSSTVVLAHLRQHVWTIAETFFAEVEVAHFGSQPLPKAVVECTLTTEDNTVVFRGKLPPKTLPAGQRTRVGKIEAGLQKLPAPAKYQLVLSIQGTKIENDWPIWVYPRANSTYPSNVLITSSLDAEALSRLSTGGRVLLESPALDRENPRVSFEPIVWNRLANNAQPAQTLGLLCDAKHPALAHFPTDFFQDWQWEEVVRGARAYLMNGLEVRPIVQVIDDWNTNRKLGLIFECRVGRGKLLVCTADLSSDLPSRPAARQLRESLLAYMSGTKFEPATRVKITELEGLLR